MTFKRELKDEEALAPLKEGIKDGKMGTLSVDPKSLEINKGNCSSLSLIPLCYYLIFFSFSCFITKKLRDDPVSNRIVLRPKKGASNADLLLQQSIVITREMAVCFISRQLLEKFE